MKHMKKIMAMGLVACTVLMSLSGCGTTVATQEPSAVKEQEENTEAVVTESTKIAVLTYNSTDSEIIMFREYLKNYLGDAFGVEYYWADTITTLEEEKAFLDQAKEAGCKGVIAFTSNDVEAMVDYCGEDMFCVLQNMTPTEEEFAAIKNKPQFLGVASPTNEAEYESGAGIVEALSGEEKDASKVWLVFTGGASYGNNMHTRRATGIMDELTASGYTLTCTLDEVLTTQTPMAVAESAEGGMVYVCPGYPSVFTDNVNQALEMCEADMIAACCSLETNKEQIQDYEKRIGKDVKLGLVDCFSETVSTVVQAGEIDYVCGKYSAMVAPAFVAMVNAVNGDVNLVKENGEAFWISQDVWSANGEEAFMELYAQSVNVYDNFYRTEDLMDVIGAYNEAATYADFMNLTAEKQGM